MLRLGSNARGNELLQNFEMTTIIRPKSLPAAGRREPHVDTKTEKVRASTRQRNATVGIELPLRRTSTGWADDTVPSMCGLGPRERPQVSARTTPGTPHQYIVVEVTQECCFGFHERRRGDQRGQVDSRSSKDASRQRSREHGLTSFARTD